MKYCHQCGAQLEDEMKFCVYCGATVEEQQNTWQGENPWSNYHAAQPNGGAQNAGYSSNNEAGQVPGFYNGGSGGIEQRNIALSIVLLIVTCGLYGIYWMIKINDEVNQLAGEPQATSGAVVFLLSLVTCGIYSFYWLYKMGERCDRIKGVNGSSGILYLVIGILGLSVVDYCLIQDTINKAVQY
jgi:hypothetical protein|nr:DUF4234 domain-containing protein [uncultured Faecalimonas sp.]